MMNGRNQPFEGDDAEPLREIAFCNEPESGGRRD
jgi:hypothetical protein